MGRVFGRFIDAHTRITTGTRDQQPYLNEITVVQARPISTYVLKLLQALPEIDKRFTQICVEKKGLAKEVQESYWAGV